MYSPLQLGQSRGMELLKQSLQKTWLQFLILMDQRLSSPLKQTIEFHLNYCYYCCFYHRQHFNDVKILSTCCTNSLNSGIGISILAIYKFVNIKSLHITLVKTVRWCISKHKWRETLY